MSLRLVISCTHSGMFFIPNRTFVIFVINNDKCWKIFVVGDFLTAPLNKPHLGIKFCPFIPTFFFCKQRRKTNSINMEGNQKWKWQTLDFMFLIYKEIRKKYFHSHFDFFWQETKNLLCKEITICHPFFMFFHNFPYTFCILKYHQTIFT